MVNIRLAARQLVAPDDRDSLRREWFGYDSSVSDEELWAHNRGRYSFSEKRLAAERYAAFVYQGRVVLVAELDDWEEVQHQDPTRRKLALIGRPLTPGNPVYNALIDSDVGRARYTIWYTPDPGIAQDPAESILLTWNPDRFDWGSDYADAVEQTANGESPVFDWSTGSRKSGVTMGDRAYLLRQGVEPRGLLGSGRVINKIFQADHFDGRDRDANYVEVAWDVVLTPEEALPLEVLQAVVPSQDWTPQSSGTLIRAENRDAVESLWEAHLDDLFDWDESASEASASIEPGRASGGGQGRQLDPAVRKLIEDAAQDRLMNHYSALGWDVEDTRIGNPYDAIARRGRDVVYLEAKGTTTPGSSVIVTREEVRHAQAHHGKCVVGIWSGMTFLDDGEVDPDSGEFRILDFHPAESELEVIDYRWRLPR